MTSKPRPTVYPRDLHLAENLSPEQEVLRDALVKLDRATGSDGYEYTETVSAMEYVSEEFTEVARAFAALLNAEPAPASVTDREALVSAVRAVERRRALISDVDLPDAYTDAVIAVLDTRTVAQVKAEALREAAETLATKDFLLPVGHAPMGVLVDWLRLRADELEREDKR